MKINILSLGLILSMLTSCIQIPKETITLSETIGTDIQSMHTAHTNILNIYFDKIEDDINSFIDDTYSPYVIHYVLQQEMANFKAGKTSLYGTIEQAAKDSSKAITDAALKDMTDFQEAANAQIAKKRKELLTPIQNQENEIKTKVNQAYQNMVYANSTVTAYLKSTKKIKSTQQEAISMIGLTKADSIFTSNLIKISQDVQMAVQKGKNIDVKSDQAYDKLEAISKQLKEIINKNK